MTASTADQQTSPPALLTTPALRQLDRTPSLPFAIQLAGGERLTIHRLLRHLPGKRIAADAIRADGRRVLAKLFLSSSAKRHATRELQGIRTLIDAGIDTPPLILADALPCGGWFILTEFITGAESFRERWGKAFDLVARNDDHTLASGLSPTPDTPTTRTTTPGASGPSSAKASAKASTNASTSTSTSTSTENTPAHPRSPATPGTLGALDLGNPAHPAMQALTDLFGRLGALHHAGLIHDDLHPGNVLLDGNHLYLIDGDAVSGSPGRPVTHDTALQHFGRLIAQFPVGIEAALPTLVAAWRSRYKTPEPSHKAVLAAIDAARAVRVADYLSKARRSCTLFEASQTLARMQVVMRSHKAALADVLADPDAALARATLLKDGRSATVGIVRLGARDYVIKRYNIRHAGHAVLRAPRPSRAWHAWIAGHRLRALGIATPEPVAVIETRLGPLRGRAWLITEHCPGTALRWHFDKTEPAAPSPGEAAALNALFQALERTRITHGDLKSHNLFWLHNRIAMIDLDAMVQHRSPSAFQKAWAKDRARLLRNWPVECPLTRWLDANLPQA